MQREARLPVLYLAPPGSPVRLGFAAGYQDTHQFFDYLAAVADDRNVGPADLAQLGRVDVDVDDFGARGQRSSPAR